MDNDEEQFTFERAKYYFEHDYQDRGMVKWQGYYLSDHTEDVSKYSAKRAAQIQQKAMPEMSLEEISKILFEAYAKHRQVQIQERAQTITGLKPPIIEGLVLGFDDENVYIGDSAVNFERLMWASFKIMV
ncbi:hypothetical protein WOSG25_110570 [Weissella oryzae SG25]|uniref:DNA-directed RNA polymerase beta subunit n=1 Tax=Weissella oryzae (strain DSM 25784 / JCM 18191 / LMG 30913 / SG25) TaxID=1329250 RepID=A0A069CVR7_WEIOS|nr:hypothetical protein [Weissella oryzae]GAK31579.1 hypothetical protein WOSG25_110570 [Weissella oryzae SG25]